MRPEIPFVEFPKIHRINRNIVITEKIDGTNAQVYVDDTMTHAYAGSRSRWITPADDNFGFARWVQEHHDELLKLGPGSHSISTSVACSNHFALADQLRRQDSTSRKGS